MAKSIADDEKVMDVARPGKGKVVSTSRPVVSPIVSGSKAPNIEVKDDAQAEEIKVSAPSEARKVIQPLGDIQPEQDSASSDSPVVESVDPAAPAPDEGGEMPEVVKAEGVTDDTAGNSAASSDAAEVEASGAAEVDTLAAQAETKKQAAKRAEEEAKKEAALQELIDSKKYFVPIGHGPAGSSKKIRIFILLLFVAAAVVGGYYYWTTLAAEDSSPATESVSSLPVGAETDNEQNQEESSQEESTASSQQESRADIAARDTERKNGLKVLQQKLETYYNDNNEYPSSLTELDVSANELVGPQNDAYVYTVGPDNQTYVLTAQLENSDDRDADEDGSYIVHSVNQ